MMLMLSVGRSVYALGDLLSRSSRPETHRTFAVGRQITPIQAVNTGQTTSTRRDGEDIRARDALLCHAYPGRYWVGALHCYASKLWLQVLHPRATLLGSLVCVQLYCEASADDLGRWVWFSC